MMDCRTTILFCLAVVLMMLIVNSEGRNKKVVIHVPYKVKKLKHTHTVYKTVHHHHSYRDYDHAVSPSEDHEHFHHMHIHDDQPIAGIGIPEFLPDVAIDHALDVPDVPPHEILGVPNRHLLPLFRRV